jgi:RND family efflux transporter MFP subunit
MPGEKMIYVAFLLLCLILNPVSVHAKDRLIVLKAKKEIILTGYTRNEKTVTVSSEIEGKVLRVNFDVGQAVSYTAFIEIDPTFIQFQIENTLQSIERLEILIKKAGSRVSYLEKEFLRIEELYRGDLVTEARRDAAQQKFEQAMLELESVQKEKVILKTKLNELLERKNRHNIHAPYGWIVTERNVEEGEFVRPATPLARVSDFRQLVVPLSVSGEELSAIQSLAEVFDAKLEGKPVRVSLKWINPEFDEKTRKLKIELKINQYTGTKRGGLKLTLPVQMRTEGVYVPKAAVTNRYENPAVTVKKTGEVVYLLVIGESGDNFVIAEDTRLQPGTELTHSAKYPKAGDR